MVHLHREKEIAGRSADLELNLRKISPAITLNSTDQCLGKISNSAIQTRRKSRRQRSSPCQVIDNGGC